MQVLQKLLADPSLSILDKASMLFAAAVMLWIAYFMFILIIGAPLVEAADRHGWKTVVAYLALGVVAYLVIRS